MPSASKLLRLLAPALAFVLPAPVIAGPTDPTGIAFTHQTQAPLGTLVTSNTATIGGITVTVSISVSGGQYSVGCTGTFTAAAGTVAPGATVCVRHVTPLALGATTTTTLTVGSGSAAFNTTTVLAAGNTMPATVSTGISHNLVVTPNGQVWGWGDNTGGKLGNGNTTVSTIPVRASGLSGVIAVSAGMGHSLALKSDGTVWAWGLDDQGQLGNGGTSPNSCNVPGTFGTLTCSLVPRQVTGLDNVVAVSAGWRHSMALKRDGTVWTWGSDFYGQRGDGSTSATLPGRVTLSGSFTRVSAGYMHSVALRSDGTVWAWGRGDQGTLGTGATTATTPTPRQVTGFTRAVTDISAGGAYTLARYDNLTLVAWGANRYGTLGDFTVQTNNGAGVAGFRATPGPVTNLINVVDFSAGVSHAIARRNDGTVWSWGLNNRLQTGLATTSTTCGQQGNRPCVRDPLRILTSDGAIRVSTGGAHTLTVRPDQSLVFFGDNAVGQKGDTSGNFGQPLAPPGNLVRFDQSVYEPDFSLTPGGTFGTPGGVGRPSTAGALNLANLSDGLAFGPQGVGSTSTALVVSLNNVSDTDPIAIQGITAAGSALAGEFGISSQNCPATLDPGASCNINLVFSPQAFGDREGALTILSNATESNTISFALFGTGVDNRAPSTLSLGTTSSTSAAGQPVTFTAVVGTTGQSLAGTVVFLDNGTPIAGCASFPVVGDRATCTTGALAVGVHPITADYSGNPSVQPSSSPVVLQTVITVATPAAIPRLGNISTRMQVLTGNDVLIGGFIIGGTQAKTVVVRARGPSLLPFGITNFLVNPKLDLFSGQTVIASNDDWQQAGNAVALQATGFAPANAQEAAILITLNPGAYTGIVTGVGNTTGVGIIEVFEVDRPDLPLANISTRGQVLLVNDVMIGGFVIQGDSPQTVVVRARGPSLLTFGITNFLANPVLQLFSGQTVIASNDNWQQAANAAEIQARGFAPSNANEAAILITLTPGAYTAIVTGAGGTTGVGIIEVFAQ